MEKKKKKGIPSTNKNNKNIDTSLDTNALHTSSGIHSRFQSLGASSRENMWSRSRSQKGGESSAKSGSDPLSAVANAAKSAAKSAASAAVSAAKSAVKSVAAVASSAVGHVTGKTGKSGKSGKGGKQTASSLPTTPPFNCAVGGQPVGGGSGGQTTFSDKQACVACKFIWNNVNSAKSAGTTPDLVGQQFDSLCADAPDVFYQGCDDMYDQIGTMIKDSMNGGTVDQICGCAKLCAPDTLVGGSGSLLGAASSAVNGLLRL